jgi:chromosome segregation ATPase
VHLISRDYSWLQVSLRHANERTEQLQRQLTAVSADRDALAAAVAALEAALAESKQTAAEERAADSSAQAVARRAEQELAVLRRRTSALEDEAAASNKARAEAAETARAGQEQEVRWREELHKAGKAMLMAQVSCPAMHRFAMINAMPL